MTYVSPLCHNTLGENECSEQVGDSRKKGVLGWASPKAQPESRVPGQVAYLDGGIPLGCAGSLWGYLGCKCAANLGETVEHTSKLSYQQ